MEANVTPNMPPPRFAAASFPKKCIGFFGALGLGIALLVTSAAGPQSSSPPPTLQGQAATHLFTVPGVMNFSLATVFACTNVDSADIIVGVEVIGDAGGAALNDASATSLTLAPGATALFGTSGMNGFVIDSELNPVLPGFGQVTGGSARILATAKSGIICSAFLVDPTSPIPASAVSLSVVKKTAQQGD